MSLWEFHARVDGYYRAHGEKTEAKAPSFEDHEDLVAKYRHLDT